jgi:S1-C subfamily serine protease
MHKTAGPSLYNYKKPKMKQVFAKVCSLAVVWFFVGQFAFALKPGFFSTPTTSTTSFRRVSYTILKATKDENNGASIDNLSSINDKPIERTRRNMLLSSAAGLASSLLGINIDPSVALDDTELRRIELFERIAPSVVFSDTFTERQDTFSTNIMEVPLGTGSGFVWDKDGHIVTNYHVVRNAKFAQVAIITKKDSKSTQNMLSVTKQVSSEPFDVFSLPQLQSSSTGNNVVPYSSMRPYDETSSSYKRSVYKATVVGVDPGKDVAVLKIDAPKSELNPIPIGTSSGLRVGQGSIAIGNPFGLDHTMTAGIISGLGREIKSPIGRPITNVIQSDATINPGNSGGPLLDSSGKLIGINTAIYSPSGASAGIGFAIPIDTAKYIVDTLIRDGKIVRPVLGIGYLESKQARALGIGKGVLVLEVPPDSPAARAGLKGTRRTETGLIEIGDIIVQVGAKVINAEADLFSALENYKPGDFIDIKVVRIEAVSDTLVQKELTLTIELQSSEKATLGNAMPEPMTRSRQMYR